MRNIPIIDIADIASTDAHAEIDRACRDWGFFQVTGHGIAERTIGGLFAAARTFFTQPGDVKRKIRRSAENPWGYYDEELTRNTPDWKQVFDYGPADGDTLPPRWPADVPGFQPAVMAYYEACESLAQQLLGVISGNLGMPAGHLAACFEPAHTSFVRLNYYPAWNPEDSTDGDRPFGVNQHSDAGALTVLLQDTQPGLEVCRDDDWFLVEPVPGALVINIGDMVQVWSNDRYRAALHRVVTSSGRDRYSAPYFFNPSYETDYAPLPGMVDEDNPPRYRAINWREFRALRHAGDYADYGDDVQISDYRI